VSSRLGLSVQVAGCQEVVAIESPATCAPGAQVALHQSDATVRLMTPPAPIGGAA
jgi:hypothetical protein